MGSVFFWLGLCAVFLGSQGLQIEINLWIRKWAANYDPRVESVTVLSIVLAPVAQTLLALGPAPLADDNFAFQASAASGRADSTTFYLSWYVILSVIYLVSIALRMGWLFYGSLRASASLYDDLLRRVLGARVRFFDSTPTGRVLNRFSKASSPACCQLRPLLTFPTGFGLQDIANVDQEAAPVFMYLLTSVLSCIVRPTLSLCSEPNSADKPAAAPQAVVVVIATATPLFVIGAALIVCLYWLIGAAYLALSRELKRIESVSRSPIFIAFGEALTGMVSIRSYGENARFTDQAVRVVDNNNKSFALLWQSNRWLSVCCDCSGSLVALFASVFVLLNSSLDAGTAAVSLSCAWQPTSADPSERC